MNEDNLYAVVPAAGKGERFGNDIPKQYLPLNGRTVLEHTLTRLANHQRIAQVVVAIAADDTHFEKLAGGLPSNIATVHGGAERCHSVLAGLEWLCERAPNSAWVMVHDAARPCLRASDIDRMIAAVADGEPGAILGLPVRDTLKRGDADDRITDTVDRTAMWRALTPQLFQLGPLRNAIESALDADLIVTDEAQSMERSGVRPKLVHGHGDNIKITHREDLELAESIMQAQERAGGGGTMRIGQGYDAHRFTSGDHVVLGGVEIPFDHGLAAHSDGDVLLHAICDALLGAAALGDIGRHFPDSDPAYAGISSRELLRQVSELLQQSGYVICNVDATLIAEQPKIAPRVKTMCDNVAADMGLAVDAVNIKATTTEQMGFTGRGEGIAASAVCLIELLSPGAR